MKKMTISNAITLFRVILVAPFVVFLMQWTTKSAAIALVIFLIASFSDFLDGFLARKRHEITDLGAFLDPLADKMLVNTAFVCFAVLGAVPVWVPIVFICRDFMVDGVRMLLAKKGTTVSAQMAGKAKTAMQMITTIVIITWKIIPFDFGAIEVFGFIWMQVIVRILTIVAVALSVISGVEYLELAFRK